MLSGVARDDGVVRDGDDWLVRDSDDGLVRDREVKESEVET